MLLQMGPTIWLNHAVVVCALLYMRSQPERFSFSPRAYRNPLVVHLLFLALCASLVVVPLWSHPMRAVVIVGLLSVCYAIYYTVIRPIRRRGEREQEHNGILHKLNSE